MQIVQVYRSLALRPGQSLRFETTPTFTCATSFFHRKEWFGNISIKMEEENERERTCYAQSRHLFKCNVKEITNNYVTKELCLVKMYEEIEFDNTVKCPVLKWFVNNQGSYKVIDINRIMKSIHIVPDFRNVDQYFVNMYKF